MNSLAVLIPLLLLGSAHTLLYAYTEVRKGKSDKKFDKRILQRGFIALASGLVLFCLSGGAVSLIVSMAIATFGVPTGDALSLSEPLRNIIGLLAQSMVLSALIGSALWITGSCVIALSAGKKQYVFTGVLFYILVLAMIFVGSAVLYIADLSGIVY